MIMGIVQGSGGSEVGEGEGRGVEGIKEIIIINLCSIDLFGVYVRSTPL